jgi:hypothetical protein
MTKSLMKNATNRTWSTALHPGVKLKAVTIQQRRKEESEVAKIWARVGWVLVVLAA